MSELTPEYWQKRYTDSNTGWDIGYAGPLAKIIDDLKEKSLKILIPGAGNGYEAEYAWKKGFKNIYVLDYAQEPLLNLKNRVPEIPGNQLIQTNFFDHSGQYDIILEQTFFCALNPELRTKYVEKMYSLLKTNGILTGVFFNFPLDSGPPFGGDAEEYKRLFGHTFGLAILESCNFSIKPRMDKELYFKFLKQE